MTVLEGSEGFGPPCTEVLSVAGFYALLRTFLAGERFILRVKKGSERSLLASSLQPQC